MSKQYLLMVDEGMMAVMRHMMGDKVMFLEVEGMSCGKDTHKILVTPLRPPVPNVEVVGGDVVDMPKDGQTT